MMTLAKIEALLSKKIGIAANIIGERKIAKAAQNRQIACGLADLDTYFKILQTSNQELEELIEQIVVPETWFFRDRKPFDLLINYVQSEWLKKSGSTKLRLLSVPCSSGEEPYSMAIALIEAGLSVNRFSIDAIDISKHAIAKAQRAIYGKNSFRGEDWIHRDRYFQQTVAGYEVIAPVRSTVNFRQGNLLDVFSAAQSKYDIIFCRNLLIYLEPTACTQVFNTLDRLLLPNGLLFVGAAETGKVPSDRFMSIRQSFTFAYRKSEAIQLQPPVIETSVSTDLKQSLQFNKNRVTPIEQPNSLVGNATFTRSVIRRPASQLPYNPIQSTSEKNHIKINSGLELAKQLADVGQVEKAINYCQDYLTRDFTNSEAYTLLGTLYQAKSENFQAERCFQKALYLNPNCYEALMHLSLLKEHRGDITGAEILQQRIQKVQQTSHSSEKQGGSHYVK
ncbi:CheR family methyltransferase [Trichocoleus sp. DQ-U1]|uniref:CheR family methyltransferase n=1 Tax=Trichocoleus sp. DQ-U1 TaxID=2933926 RepID=UPI00329A4495